MCLALPARVLSVDAITDTATVAIEQVKVEVSLALLENIQEGDYVLVHVGYALQKISEEEAQKTLDLFAAADLTGNSP